ncbi:MAG: hypothetical protein H7Z42_05540 [Roseiflexaceae bacterium]|nr:hypothetical protein [Roseiflexaceae bacterium]
MTNTTKLTEAIRDSGIRSVNFFNGRLLTGEDLRSEQQAGRNARTLLGRAIGPGVAEGLFAESKGTAEQLLIHITAGVAINRLGQALTLASEKDIALVEPPDNSVTGTAGFRVCGDASTGFYVAGSEFYVLTIAPAEYSEGRALVSGLASATAACNTKLIVETAQFRLLPLELNLTSDAAHSQNLAAYSMFGATSLAKSFGDPFNMLLKPPPVPQGITDCDVPLALIQIVDGKLTFVDAWAVRRACAAPGSAGRWEALFDAGAERRVDAMLYQFQAQLEAIPTSEQASMKATDRFHFLPPVGLVPLAFSQFFDGLKVTGPLPIAPASVGPLVQAALHALPMNLDNDEAIWRFEVRGGANGARTYDIFVSGYAIDLLPRYNQSRLNAALFAVANDAQPIV